MKWIHIFSLLVASALIFACYAFSGIKAKDSPVKDSLKRLLRYAYAGVTAYIAAFLFPNRHIAEIAYSLHHILLLSMVMALVMFIRDYTGVKRLIRKEMYYIGIPAAADCIILLLNPFIHCTFRTALSDDGSYYYIVKRTVLYRFHFVLVYMIILLSVIILLQKLISSPKIYRLKYLSLLISLCFVTIAHALYINLRFTFDYSVFFYAAISFIVFYFSVIYIPRGLTERLMLFTIANMNDGLVCIDADGKIIHSNKNANDYLGDSSEEGISIINKRICEWFYNHPEAKDHEEITWKTTRCINGENKHFINDYKRFFDTKGKYLGCFFIFHDRTQEYKRLSEEKYRSSHDSLTGLYNIEHFEKKSVKIMNSEPDVPYFIICADVKHFKLINDLFGVEKGDKLLKAIADTLIEAAGNSAVCGRLSGDRFAVCMPQSEYCEEDFTSHFEKLTKFFGDDIFKVYIHFGVYRVSDKTLRVSVMCDRAILAIKTIKEKCENCLAYYEKSMRETFISKHKLISEFERALMNGQFIAYIQPQITTEGNIFGGEALVRWQHPERGFVSPSKFIDVFEQTGLISRLDSYVWELACIQLNKWYQEGLTNHYISVNISQHDFMLMDVYEVLTLLIDKYSIPPANLHLEITETAITNDTNKQLELIQKLRKKGFVVEIDDFGSGYSSLNTLKDLNVDVLKIDMGFLLKTENHERSMIILKTVIALAKSLNMEVITEGVETQEQVIFLRECGCDVFQGYFFAKPMQISDFEAKFMSNY